MIPLRVPWYGMYSFHFYRCNQFKVIPLDYTPRTRKFAYFNLRHLYLAPPLKVIYPFGISPKSLTPVWCCLRDPRFSRLGRTQTCDGRTDRQTSRQTKNRQTDNGDSLHGARIASRSKKTGKRGRRSLLRNGEHGRKSRGTVVRVPQNSEWVDVNANCP